MLVLIEKLWPAMFTAILFAVHPIVTESVTNIVGRADLFATLAVLLSFVLYAKSGTVSVERKPSLARWLGAVGLTAALAVFLILHRAQPGAVAGRRSADQRWRCWRLAG